MVLKLRSDENGKLNNVNCYLVEEIRHDTRLKKLRKNKEKISKLVSN